MLLLFFLRPFNLPFRNALLIALKRILSEHSDGALPYEFVYSVVLCISFGFIAWKDTTDESRVFIYY